MSLDWLPRDNELKDHRLIGGQWWGTEAPCTVYEKRPLAEPDGRGGRRPLRGLDHAEQPQAVQLLHHRDGQGRHRGLPTPPRDRSVVAVVFTGAGDAAFCTGGNAPSTPSTTPSGPNEYGEYMDLFNAMVDSILDCKKPVICRVNGMRVAGGQEIGTGLRPGRDVRHGGLRSGRTEARLGSRGRFHRLPALVPLHRRRHVELHLVRDVVGLQDEGQGPGVEDRAGAQEGRRVRAQPAGPHRAVRARRRDRVRRAEGRRRAGRRQGPGQGVLHDLSLVDDAVQELVWRFANLFPGSLQTSIDLIA